MTSTIEIIVNDTCDHRARQLADALQALTYPNYLPDGTAECPPRVCFAIGRESVNGYIKESRVRYDGLERWNGGHVTVSLTIES